MKTWKKLLICSVSLIIFFFAEIAIDIACGGEADPYDYYVSFFHNNIQRTQEYEPFYFTSYSFLYNDNEQVSEATLNSREWAAYLGHGVKAEDVEKAMYHLKGNADTALYNGYLVGKGPLPDSLKSNTFLQSLASNKSALNYYQFAKDVESIANVKFEYWNPKEIDTESLKKSGEEALSSANTENDKFIKLRYLYQAQRLMHYGKYYKEAADVYDKYLVNYKTDSHVKGWALALKAGESRWLKDTVRSAYLFSKIFAEYPERRVQAYRNFNYMRVKTPDVLALAANKNEKAVIHAIDGFSDPSFNINPLKEVYDYDPSSDMVGVLLIREINKLEEQYLSSTLIPSPTVSSYYGNLPDSSKNKALAHIKQLKTFCQKLAAEKKYPEYTLGNLAQAYLAWMQKDTKAGLEYLAALNSEKLSSRFNDQKQIIQLLLTAQGIQQYNEVNEATLLPSLKWLDDKVMHEINGNTTYKDYYGLSPFAITARNFYQDIMAPAYLKQGDTSKAAIAMLQGDANKATDASYQTINYWQNYLHSSALNKIISWKKIPPANAYLHFLTQKLGHYSNDDLYELLGTACLREHKYAEAVTALKGVSNKKLNAFPTNFYDDGPVSADPFISQMPDYPKVFRRGNKTEGYAAGYNKRQFAQAMAGFQKQIKADPKNASAYYFTMGTALYNTSTYGNAWYLISYSWSSTDYGRSSLYYYDVDYIKTTNAEKYFLKARQLSANTEFKAKCTFMAAKCRQKQIKLPSYMDDYRNYDYTKLKDAEKDYDKVVRRNPYFAELQKGYAKTAYYKLAVNECSYLRDYLKSSKK